MDYLLEVAQYLTKGAFVSLSVFLVTLVFSFPIGLILSMLQRKNKIIKRAIAIYTWFFRGTPLMLQLFFFMYGLPFIGINVNRMMVAFFAFVINYSAYFVEIIRAGIESLPKDQFESASMMGATSYQT